ncbi:MAG: VOC family protein [Candidatus Promineifilaceae bacterium]|jgi:extradiol dioxygenase family protein
MLANMPLAATIPFVDLGKARRFYGDVLGLSEMDMPIPDDPDGNPGGLVYQAGNGTMLFIYARSTPTKADHTAVAWMVDDVDAVADDLISRGIKFETYPDMPNTEWDDRGVATMSGSDEKTAWFRDPEGNILAIGSSSM